MGQTIRINELADTVMKGLKEYAQLAADDLKEDVKKAGKTVKQQIESTAPRKTGKYAKSWAVWRRCCQSMNCSGRNPRYGLHQKNYMRCCIR